MESIISCYDYAIHCSKLAPSRWFNSSIIRSCRLIVVRADYSYRAMSNIFDCFCF